jgi:RNA polymerase sigma-70 factor, ECF subfamily
VGDRRRGEDRFDGAPPSLRRIRKRARALKCPKTPSPDARSKKAEILAALRDGVATALTDRQRVAVVGELRGVSSVALASKLGLSRNALYKLVHDARKNLKRALLRRGFDAEAARDVLSEGRP